MSLLVLPERVNTLVVGLDGMVKADSPQSAPVRRVFFETSREGVEDREGEDIAAEALWKSRKLFLEQGNLDIWHWSWLGNPPGSGGRPEYVIGVPEGVERSGKSIYVQGRIFSAADGTEGENLKHANQFYDSLFLQPPMRWYPSVLGKLTPNATVAMETRKGRTVKVIKGPLEWYSVGFAPRVQHPELPAVQPHPVGPFAKAVQVAPRGPSVVGNVAVMSWGMFAKAMTVAGDIGGAPSEARSGLPALRREAHEDKRTRYKKARRKVLRRVMAGDVSGELPSVAKAFEACGYSPLEAVLAAQRLGRELDALL